MLDTDRTMLGFTRPCDPTRRDAIRWEPITATAAIRASAAVAACALVVASQREKVVREVYMPPKGTNVAVTISGGPNTSFVNSRVQPLPNYPHPLPPAPPLSTRILGCGSTAR